MSKNKISKPRNHIVLALLRSNRKAGRHEKPNKAERRADKVKMSKRSDDLFVHFI